MEDELKKLKVTLHQKNYKIKELEGIILKDPLTGLLNRRGFTEFAERIRKDAAWEFGHKDSGRKYGFGSTFAILFFDIDNFKKVNDTYGHEVGDKLLQRTAGIIEGKVRVSDIAARWGGEELVALLPGARERDGVQKAEEIRKAVKSRVKLPEKPELTVSLSIGVAEFNGTESLADLIKRADGAMYRAKTSGKDRVVAA